MRIIFTLFNLMVFALALTPSTISGPGPEADWPQWQGPDRTGIAKETGLLKEWPASGPQVVWAISDLGEGYGSLSI